MKISRFCLVIIGFFMLFIISCNRDDDKSFIKSDLGYYFKHCIINENLPKAKQGDILYGEIEILKNDSILVYSNFGNPERLFQIQSPQEGSVDEFLLNLHLGDSAIIIIPGDSVSKYVPNLYTGKNDMLYFYIKIHRLISIKEIDERRKKLMELEDKEFDTIEYYIEKHSLDTQKQESGLYFILINEGTGKKPYFGDEVKVNYSVSTLDGKIIDTNILPIAKGANLYHESRNYEPFSFYLGDDGVIAGWTEGISLMREGGRARFIIPSKLAYGSEDFGPIKAHTSLIFEVSLVEVNK